MLMQVGPLYTPAIFDFLQKEYQRSISACAEALDGQYKYMVKIGYPFEHPIFEEEWEVTGNPVEQTSSCSCGQFDRLGILCAHALKVLDLMNIKLLPSRYILKRWTREARAGSVKDSHGRIVIADPNIEAVLRHNGLSHKFNNLATEASHSEECCILIDNTLDNLSKEVKRQLLNVEVPSPASDDLLNAKVTPPATTDLLAAACLLSHEFASSSAVRARRSAAGSPLRELIQPALSSVRRRPTFPSLRRHQLDPARPRP